MKEDCLSIVIWSARVQRGPHAPRGNSPAWLEVISRGGFALAGKAARQFGGDSWFRQQRSDAVGAKSPLYQAKALSASRFRGKKPTSSSIADFEPETAGKVISRRTGKVLGPRRLRAPLR